MGIPTFIMGAALDILRAGKPPRASFIDYPLGTSAGKPFDRENQIELVRSSLSVQEGITEAGSIITLPLQWPEGWEKKNQMEQIEGDQRSPRDTTPRYQTEEDRMLAEN
ncbi:MAG: hypothetical protein HQM13_09105 [SAR324 cluster bacterium]|nr:hypothetical protein [SAR324 cluster bacterium]